MEKLFFKNTVIILIGLVSVVLAAMQITDNISGLGVESAVKIMSNDISGAELYRLNCAGCHGVDLKGNPPAFPALTDIKSKMSKAEIVAQVRNGKGAMPPMTHLSDEEVAAIVSFLYGEDTGNTIAVPMDAVAKGEMLFKSNCAGCHRAVSTDPQPQNANTKMCGMMEPVALSVAPQWYSKEAFARVLDMGPCYMPSFAAGMKREDKDAIYDYLATLKDDQVPAKRGRGMMMNRHRGKRKGGWRCYQ